jgi:hypothetical protein
MEPNKLEKLFREKLESREIKPSEGSWDRLDAMLTVAEEPKPKRKFRWLYLAASVVGILLMGTVFFNQKDAVVNAENKVVIMDSVSSKAPEVSTSITVNEKSNYSESEHSAIAQSVIPKINTVSTSNKESLIVNSSNQNQIPEVSIIHQKTEQKSISIPTNAVSVDELLAAVTNPSKNDSPSSEKSNVRVNANNLLTQVDGELELTFREKVINKVNKNYQSVKVALSNRNNQE